MKKHVFYVLLALLFIPLSSRAQGLGSIEGRVTDPTGAAVASAKVVATQQGTTYSRTAVTDTEGLYVIPSLQPSTYNLTVEAAGFGTSKENGIILLADQTLTVNFGLKLGVSTEVVMVSGNALQVDTSTSTLKQVIEQQRLVELPLNGRNAAQLTLLVPGTVNSPGGGADQGTTKTFPGAVTISANGSRQNQVSYQLDGGNYVDEYTNVNQPFPFPDALQEFSVQTSNYSAEYGQNAGAVVNVITKSGTNNFHGDVFEFVRNAVFNARNFFAPLTQPNGSPTKDTGRDQLKRNQFGGTIGGPILHDKTFFFAGFQGTRLRNVGNPTTSTVPSQADITAFTAGGGKIDPTVANLLPFLPIQPTSRSVTFIRPDQENFNEVLGRVDHSFSQNDRLSVRYDYNYFSKAAVFVPTNILTYADGSKIANQNYLIHETHVFRPSLLNDFRFSYAREKATRGPDSGVPSVQSLGSMIPFQPPGHAIQQIRVNGFFNFGDNPQAAFVRNNFTWSDDVSWVRGNHDFRFGGVIERSRVDLNNLFFQPAEFSFPSLPAFLSGALGDYSGGNVAFRQGAGEFKNNRGIFSGVYAQDSYKINRRLSVNLGLRYEPALPWREIKGRVEQFRLSGLIAGVHSTRFPNAPAGVYFQGDPGVPENGVNSSWKDFAPRVGFAYDVFGDGKTSLRGGAGIFYDTRIPGIINNRFVDVTPFSPQLILSSVATSPAGKPGSLTDPLCTQASTQMSLGCAPATNLFPAPFPPPSNATFAQNLLVVSWDPNHSYQAPTLYNWNLAVERELLSNVLVRAAYAGSHGSHLKETIAFNVSPVGSVTPAPRLNAIAGSNVFGTTNNGPTQDAQDINSFYHSLQLSAEKRMSHGLTILGSYTWSKSIDDLPNGGGVADIGADTVSPRPWDDPLRHQFDRGLSDFDHTHRFVGSYVWQLPGLSGRGNLMRQALGAWEFGGVVSAQTGRPYTVLQGTNASGTGIGQDRATFCTGQNPNADNAPPNNFNTDPCVKGSNPFAAGACAAAGITTPCVDWLNPLAFEPSMVPDPTKPDPKNPGKFLLKNNPLILGTFGTMGKNSFRLPGAFTWDMDLVKNFAFTERWRLQFRAEFFNVFNRANFMDDSASLTNFQKVSSTNNFGAIRQAADPRIGQLALKLFF
jgi:Carboxypeptidase regulatory-like domain/TonB dependent receptor